MSYFGPRAVPKEGVTIGRLELPPGEGRSPRQNTRLFTFTSEDPLCAPHVVSPRDQWLCVLPRWQINVNVNVNIGGPVCRKASPIGSTRSLLNLGSRVWTWKAMQGFLEAPLLDAGTSFVGDYPRHPRKFESIANAARFEKPLRRRNLALFALSALQLALAYTSLELSFEEIPTNYTKDGVAIDPLECDPGVTFNQTYTRPLCFVNFGLTVLLWLVLYSYYDVKYKAYCSVSLVPRDPLAHVYRAQPGSQVAMRPPSLWRGPTLKVFLIEAILLAVQPVPWVSALWYEQLAFAINLRLPYLALRIVRDFSTIFQYREMLRREAGLPFLTWGTTVRLVYARHSLKFICVMFFYAYLTLTYWVHVIERDCNPEFSKIGNSAWFVLACSDPSH